MLKIEIQATARRTYLWMLAVTAAGSVGALLYGGAPWLTGFLTGAGFSAVNFWMLHKVVQRVGETGGEEGPRKASPALFGLRYLLFAAFGYGILNAFGASLAAALAGIFVSVAAVFLEAIFELIYGTTS